MYLRKKNLIFVLILFFFSSQFCFSAQQKTGEDLCNQVFSYFSKKGLSPYSQSIINGGTNNFPYNIILSFPSTQQKTSNNLTLCFKLEEILKNKDYIVELSKYINQNNFDYNIFILIAYGESQHFVSRNLVYGSEVYAKSLSSTDNNVALNINLYSTENSVVTGSLGISAPSWLIKNTYNAYKSQEINQAIPLFYISQFARYRFNDDRVSGYFLINDIPCITANFNLTPEEQFKAEKVLENFLQNFYPLEKNFWDQHSVMVNFWGRNIWLSEFDIIRLILICIFLSFIFVFCLGFINSTIQHKAWLELRKNWYVIPATILITTLSFLLGKGLYLLFHRIFDIQTHVFNLPILQISINFIVISIIYTLEVRFHKIYSERSIDFLVMISSLVNLILFTFIDVSLFPLFLVFYALSVLCTIFRKSIWHVIIYALIVFIYIPCIYKIYNNSSETLLKFILLNTKSLPLIFSFILLPLNLIWFRIYTKVEKKDFTIKNSSLTVFITFVILLISFSVLSNTLFKKQTEIQSLRQIPPAEDDNSLIHITYKDEIVFDEAIRTVQIELGEEPVICNFNVDSIMSTPVLYSDNDYRITNSNSVSFLIPANPPTKMSFSYGTNKSSSSSLNVTAVFWNEEQNFYFTQTKNILVEGQL